MGTCSKRSRHAGQHRNIDNDARLCDVWWQKVMYSATRYCFLDNILQGVTTAGCQHNLRACSIAARHALQQLADVVYSSTALHCSACF